MPYPIQMLQMQTKKEQQFINKGFTTIEDLAWFFPRKYIDFRNITSAAETEDGQTCTLAGTVVEKKSSGQVYWALVREDQARSNGMHPHFIVKWFGTNYHIKKLETGKNYVFCGKVTFFQDSVQMVSPLAFGEDPNSLCKIYPIYSKYQGISDEYMKERIQEAIRYLDTVHIPTEKDRYAEQLGLMGKLDAIKELHNPSDNHPFLRAKERIAYEEMYDFYEALSRKEQYETTIDADTMKKTELLEQIRSSLPYQLSADQASVVETIVAKAKIGKRIHALISGDVGCGKTIVAILAAVYFCENGYQTMIMAPTLVLAQQHYQEVQKVVKSFGIQIGLLTTETKKAERKKLLESFQQGKLQILIGTHALLSDDIKPARLGLTIVDEEHKFGVKQKEKLEEQDKNGVHHVSMTATPIPRSIAQTVYGNDTEIMTIATMPNGRKPIITKQCHRSKEALEQIYEEIQKGRQAYIVCPFIEKSEHEQFQNVISVEQIAQAAQKFYAKKDQFVSIGVINGDMKQSEVLQTIQQFAEHKLDILIATTMIEVGVNVPNASIIAIMSAERFGVAALHQLRGRVGRGTEQGYCLLCAPVTTERLELLCEIQNGFLLAEKDMELRGPGDIVGHAQSGDNHVIEVILKRPKMAATIRQYHCQKTN